MSSRPRNWSRRLTTSRSVGYRARPGRSSQAAVASIAWRISRPGLPGPVSVRFADEYLARAGRRRLTIPAPVDVQAVLASPGHVVGDGHDVQDGPVPALIADLQHGQRRGLRHRQEQPGPGVLRRRCRRAPWHAGQSRRGARPG